MDNIKSTFREGVKYALKKYSSILYSRDDDFFKYQDGLLEKANTLTEIMNVIWLATYSSTWNYAFEAPQNVQGDGVFSLSNVQYGISPTEWYFFYGIAGKYCFNITFIRIPISPLIKDDKYNIWTVNGGYGIASENKQERTWFRLKPEYIFMDYTKTSYSTFNLSGKSDQTPLKISLNNTEPMTFGINISFDAIEGGNHNIDIIMKANSPPSPNAQGACLGCSGNIGSMYYSYTNMAVQMKVGGDEKVYTGIGWQDHQLIKGGIPVGLKNQALMAVTNTLLRAVTGGWTWYAIQDLESGIQYMLTHFYIDKFYKDDIPSKLNTKENIKPQMVNVYKDGIAYFNPTEDDIDSNDTRIYLLETVENPDKTFTIPENKPLLPSKYDITLPGGKEVVLEIATLPNVYPIAPAPYETPAYVKNEKGVVIGVGLIEANGYFTNEEMAKRAIIQAGGDPDDKKSVEMLENMILKKQKWYQKLLSFIIAGIPILVFILSLVFVFKNGKHKKELDGKTKVLIAVFVNTLVYVMLK
jgi:hypothetical protein